MDVGDLLGRARSRAGLSVRGLAEVAGVSRELVWRYESGRVSPTVATLDRLLAACGVQVRTALEPLLADLDARVDALSGPVPELAAERWTRFAGSLDDLPSGSRAPRRGPVRWAVDGASALVLHGLAVPVSSMDVVVQLDEALRFWRKAVQLQGLDARERIVQDWYDASLERMQQSLGEPRFSMIGMVRVRVVETLPRLLTVVVPWRTEPVCVVSVEEVERTHPEHAEVLARWRQRREQDVA